MPVSVFVASSWIERLPRWARGAGMVLSAAAAALCLRTVYRWATSRTSTARQFTFAELEQATGAWATTLGSDASSTVFYGRLSPDVPIAVKRFHDSYQDARTAFEAELHALSLLHHPNVVRHIRYCDEGPWCSVFPATRRSPAK